MVTRSQPTINHKDSTRSKTRLIGGKEKRSVGDVNGLPNPSEWIPRRDFVQYLRVNSG